MKKEIFKKNKVTFRKDKLEFKRKLAGFFCK